MIFVWYGKKCENVLKSKARLKTEKTNKNEHKNKASIYIFFQGDEPQLFWMSLHDHNNSSMESQCPTVLLSPFSVNMCLTTGQLSYPGSTLLVLAWDLLNTKNVNILDCFTDLFVWVGKKYTIQFHKNMPSRV